MNKPHMTENFEKVQYREHDWEKPLPAYAWPGGYPIFYITKSGVIYCPDCAMKVEQDDEPLYASGINWEDPFLVCEACEEPIEEAYPED